MRKLLEFIRSTYVAVLFVVLEAIAIGYYARSTPYTQARLQARSNQLFGGVHGMFAGVRHYFGLGRENRMLLGRVSSLEEQLAIYREAETRMRLDSCVAEIGVSKYRVTAATVISNTVDRRRNMLIINRGVRDSIMPDMSVLTPDGAMIGYVVDCTERYCIAMSVLNTSFRASGKLVGSDYFGSIYWDGLDPEIVVLDEVSKYASPQPGQQVVSTGFSQYFPPDVPIGRVVSAALNETQTAYTVRVRLAAEMTRVTDVLLVENRDKTEIIDLLQSEKVKDHTRTDN